MRRWIEPVAVCSVPLVLLVCARLRLEQTGLFILLTAALACVTFFLRFERARPRPRDIMPIVVLIALAVVGRLLFMPFPDVKPVSALVIITGVCFGRQSGFVTGALTALVSNLYFGQGAYTPIQMFAWGFVGYLAGVLNDAGVFRRKWVVYLYGFLSGLLYGFLLDTWYLLSFIAPCDLSAALASYALGLPHNLLHGGATATFLLALYGVFCKILLRVKRKYGIV